MELCKHDKMVLISYSDTDISSQEKEQIKLHLEECESCKKRWDSLQHNEKRVKNIEKEQLVTQTCGKEYLDLAVDKNTIDGHGTIITAGGVNSDTSGKISVIDNRIKGNNTIIAGGSVYLKNTLGNTLAETITPKKPIPVTSLNPITRRTSSDLFVKEESKTQKKYRISVIGSFDTSSEHVDSLEAYLARYTKKISKYLTNQNHKIISCSYNQEKDTVETSGIDILLQYKLEFGFRLEASIAKVKNGDIKRDHLWGGSKSVMYEEIEENIPRILDWLLPRE